MICSMWSMMSITLSMMTISRVSMNLIVSVSIICVSITMFRVQVGINVSISISIMITISVHLIITIIRAKPVDVDSRRPVRPLYLGPIPISIVLAFCTLQ